ncbi:Uncharacterized protein Fot_03886 [Forsythia ovata]|uniref:Uncharacterized protein n=1 Tax=Forsythia ovata TaxID=205694 RepID=A0ABD1XB25_9LAMI
MDAPPLGDLIGGSIASQQLAPALLPSDDSRKAMPAPSGSLAASIPPPISGLPSSATPISPILIAPRMAPALNQNGDSRPNLPAPQAPSGASNQQAIGGVPGSVGLPLNQISEPSKSLDPIAEDPSDANTNSP